MEDEKLIDLRQLVTFARMPDDRDETVQAVYHQSYALVTWLCRFRTSGMRDYLSMMRLETHGESTPQRHLQVFKNAFGDLTRLERRIGLEAAVLRLTARVYQSRSRLGAGVV